MYIVHQNMYKIKFKTNIIRLLAGCQSIFIYLCFIPQTVWEIYFVALNFFSLCTIQVFRSFILTSKLADSIDIYECVRISLITCVALFIACRHNFFGIWIGFINLCKQLRTLHTVNSKNILFISHTYVSFCFHFPSCEYKKSRGDLI